MTITAVTPSEIIQHQQTAFEMAVEECVARVNAHLRARAAFPAGHWDVAGIVPIDFRVHVATRFEAAGWKCSYSTDNTDYADCFTIRPAPSEGPYR